MRQHFLFSISASVLLTFAGCSFGAPHDPTPSTATGAAPSASARGPRAGDTADTASDRVITDRVRTLFVEDSELAHVEDQVHIATASSVVTLTGRVATDRQRLVMAAHARATEGVAHLDNRIALAP